MKPLRLVDAHVHFWDPARLPYPWLASVPELNRPFLPTDLQAASASAEFEIERCVFVECGCDPARSAEEARWVLEWASREPRIAGIVAHASVELGAAVEADLRRLAANPLVKGVRRLLQDEADDAYCLQPSFIEGVRAVGRLGLSFDLCIYHRQLGGVIELVRRCPEVTFVLDHVGKPGIRDRRLDPWRMQMGELASLPNVWCKLSGLVTEADHARWTPSDLRPYIEHALECFGFERTLFGGDWPVSTLACEYPRWVATVVEAVEEATEAQREALFRGTATRVYRLDA